MSGFGSTKDGSCISGMRAGSEYGDAGGSGVRPGPSLLVVVVVNSASVEVKEEALVEEAWPCLKQGTTVSAGSSPCRTRKKTFSHLPGQGGHPGEKQN